MCVNAYAGSDPISEYLGVQGLVTGSGADPAGIRHTVESLHMLEVHYFYWHSFHMYFFV